MYLKGYYLHFTLSACRSHVHKHLARKWKSVVKTPPSKTVESLIDSLPPPPHINNSAVQVVCLGTTVTSHLKWETHSSKTIKWAHHRTVLPRAAPHVSPRIQTQFHRATMESVLTFSVTVWCPASFGRTEGWKDSRASITPSSLPVHTSSFSSQVQVHQDQD